GGQVQHAHRVSLHLVRRVGVGQGTGDAGDGVHDTAGADVAALDEVGQDLPLLLLGVGELLGHQLDRRGGVGDSGAGQAAHLLQLGADVVEVEEGGDGVAGLGGDQGQVLVLGVGAPAHHALVQAAAEVDVPGGVGVDGHAVVTDLDQQAGHDGERAFADLAVGDDEAGEHDRVVGAALAGERAAVVAQQVRGQGADLLADDADVHAPLGQVAAV